MEISYTKVDNVLVITPEVEALDAKEAPQFKQKALEIIEKYDALHVVFDLHHLQFIDSSGLGCFLSVLRVLHAQGGELKLAKMSQSIRNMFELVFMHKVFEIYNTTEEAIKSFKVNA